MNLFPRTVSAIALIVTSGVAATFGGCSHAIQLRKTQTTLTYADRLPVTVGLYVPPDVTGQTYQAPGTGACNGHTFPMPGIGAALADAVQSGLEVSCTGVVVLTSMPNPESMKAQGLRFVVIPRVTNIAGDITSTSAVFSVSHQMHFQASLTLSIVDREGKAFYSFTANGSGIGSGSGTCGEAATYLQQAAESALRQVGDAVAQTITSATQVRTAASDR